MLSTACWSRFPRKRFSFAVRLCRFDLLQKPECQERQKNAGHQSQVCMGEYFFTDTSLQIRQVSRKCVVDGTLKTEAESYRNNNGREPKHTAARTVGLADSRYAMRT